MRMEELRHRWRRCTSRRKTFLFELDLSMEAGLQRCSTTARSLAYGIPVWDMFCCFLVFCIDFLVSELEPCWISFLGQRRVLIVPPPALRAGMLHKCRLLNFVVLVSHSSAAFCTCTCELTLYNLHSLGCEFIHDTSIPPKLK